MSSEVTLEIIFPLLLLIIIGGYDPGYWRRI